MMNYLLDRELFEFEAGISCATPGKPYILHSFPAHKWELTDCHREHLNNIAFMIKRSFLPWSSRPIENVHIVGHAATWGTITQEQYKERARKRAINAKTYLEELLSTKGLSSSKVEITISQKADSERLVNNNTKKNRALNRRVEIFLFPTKKKKKKLKKDKPIVRITKKCCKKEHREILNLHIRQAVRGSRLAQKRFKELALMSESERAISWNNGSEKIWFGSYKRGQRKTPFKYVKRIIDTIRNIFLNKNPHLIIQCYYMNDAPDISSEECFSCKKNGLNCIEEPFNPNAYSVAVGFTCTCEKRNYRNPLSNPPEPPPYRIFLTNAWFYNSEQRSTTIIHEIAHLAGAKRFFDEQIGGKAARRLARRNAWGARVNADNYANYVMSFLTKN